jgi:hypothetical protein
VIDSIKDYAELLQTVFNFDAIKVRVYGSCAHVYATPLLCQLPKMPGRLHRSSEQHAKQ